MLNFKRASFGFAGGSENTTFTGRNHTVTTLEEPSEDMKYGLNGKRALFDSMTADDMNLNVRLPHQHMSASATAAAEGKGLQKGERQ